MLLVDCTAKMFETDADGDSLFQKSIRLIHKSLIDQMYVGMVPLLSFHMKLSCTDVGSRRACPGRGEALTSSRSSSLEQNSTKM